MKLSVIIPSKTIGNVVPCASAVNRLNPGCEVIVIDDGLEGRPVGVDILPGEKPFIFSRNCNIGLRYAFDCGADAAILLNDDALLVTKGGFTSLYRAWEDHQEYWLLAASSNMVGNPNQQPKGWNRIRRENKMLCFICVLIPRSTWEAVGPLDERYSIDYGCEDGDYSYAVRQAGGWLGVWDGCFVDHGRLRSTFRSGGHVSFQQNMNLFESKWGVRYGS